MTEYEKHKKEKKKVIRQLTIKLMLAIYVLSKTPNIQNWVICNQILTQIRIVQATPIKPKHTSGGITQCNLE